MMRRLALPLLMLLGACVPAVNEELPSRAAAIEVDALPRMKTFAEAPQAAPAVSNADLARDFLDLAFALESGRKLDVLTRFETPISVRVLGAAPPTLSGDLDRVLRRLRREAGLDIRRTGGGKANVTIQAVSRGEIRDHLPKAACFVVPNVGSLSEFRSARGSRDVSWSQLRTRERVAIFLPRDASPQEVRDCLHEELAQAIGPLNDLYRLPDSVFNDDNVHTVLTGYDMLVLRLHYDSALRSGMDRAEVAAALPAILARLNPAGATRPAEALPDTPRAWSEAIQTALGPGASAPARRAAAGRALAIARASGWRDHRLGFSHYAMGRILNAANPDAGAAEFARADAVFAQAPRAGLYRAYAAAQLAAHALSRNNPDAALAQVGPALEVAARHENAALLATLMMLRAEALELGGQAGEGRAVRLDSLGWARYGFGADWAVRAKLREIGALNPLKGGIGSS